MGDHGAAEPLLKRAAAGLERALGPDHPDALAGADSLAGLYHRKGDHQEAEPLYRRALAGRERVLGSNHPNTLMTVNNLGLLYQAAGDHRSAEPLLRRAVAGQEKALGPDHPDTLLSVNNLALFYKIIGYYQAAEPLYRRAMTGQEKVLGPNHPDTLQTAGNLGILLIEMGRPVEAVPLLERAYAGRGKYPAQLTRYGGALVEAYTRAERWADGARAVGEWLAEWRAKLKPGSPELGVLLAQSGKMLLRLDPAAAEPVLRECLDLWEKLDPKAWTTASARSLLGEALLLQGKLAAAEPLFVAGYEGLLADRKNIPPQGMGNLPDAAGRLAQVYLALGKPAEAARWRAERAKYPPDQAPPPRLKG